ncbi:LysM peptidoglycan-binding domain-containing protein [Bacillus tianshenii]|uniref:LysM peptidoglycan-binding domain-containing protein n=1 Tax=Sutcliffiella tianshenii TaxID=1463404 RepID=UPI001CD602E7|nr:LysM peptidoglycan-binding domain-containing protein [Bacillus tianshenii]MCA1319051.1 LysM peptidoglycan-binding domain-containing protein [Bacillus tianshenii]
MSLFYKHEWDEENKQLTLYINPSEAFYEFAVELAQPKNGSEKKGSLLVLARQYSKQFLPPQTKVNGYRVKFQNFLVAVMKEKQNEAIRESDILDYGYYKVMPDDTLKDICLQLQTKEALVRQENEMQSDTLFVGMELKVPVYRHTVVASDSLHKIAERFDTSKAAIRSMNKLQTDCLCPGMELKIPRRE